VRRLVAAVAVAIWAAAGASVACSTIPRNEYQGFAQRNSAKSAWAEAATVDWVRIESPPPPKCPRFSLVESDEESPEAELDGLFADCGVLRFDHRGGAFTAVVLERLKGGSPPRFSLTLPRDPPLFTDPRILPLARQYWVALNEKAIADSRHTGAWVDDSWTVDPRTDGLDSCGGRPTLDPAMRYVVFRKAAGGVIGLEPVLHDDDSLLARLRTSPGGRLAPQTAGIAEYFRSAEAMALVEVERCRPGRLRRPVKVRLLRGDEEAFARTEYRETSDGVSASVRVPGVNVDFVSEWAFAARMACQGRQLLLIERPFPPPLGRADAAWLRAAVGELDLAATAALDRGPEMALYASSETRVAPIYAGTVRRRDLPTDVALTGPESVTVDQAFAWFAEGAQARANRAAALDRAPLGGANGLIIDAERQGPREPPEQGLR
jgi:hypothetical protein